jgi:muramoyltetrapeptide carboxypeptidase
VKFPAPLTRGDAIAVVAPSGAFDAAAARAGIAWLASQYRVRHHAGLFTRDGYLAGSDRRRTAELQRALDGDFAAVVAARGGYGLSRIVAALDWRGFEQRPKWLVGFSDFTILHAEAWARGFASMHAHMACGLSEASADGRADWALALEQPRRPRKWTDLSWVRRGRARGPLIGGNLAMLHASAAAGRLRLPSRAVLLLEDIGERPYRVDRMLTNLIDGGHLRSVAAAIVGDFTACPAGADGRGVEEVVAERLRTLGIPIVAGMPIGHGERNDTVTLGATVEVVATLRASSVQALP